jgi:membrane-associated protease RseP (regulator of RpoE activity)
MPTLRSVRESMGDGVVLGLYKVPSRKPRPGYKRFIPLGLFLLTITVVFIDGMFRSNLSFGEVQPQDPVLLAAIYTVSLIGILGVHEAGHLLANRNYGVKASWPYFIPGFPSIIPTLGALIVLRASMPNRNVVFDVGIAGPIAGLIVTVIVSMYGSSISTLISVEEAEQLFDQELLAPLPFGESVLMIATLHLTGMVVEDTVLVASPVLFAAWLGFLITFLNLMPAWQLDGGHIARSALGVRPHRILTYVSIAILFILGFFPMALLVLFFSMRAPESSPLDDVTPLSRRRKALFFVALGMAVICAPIPNSFTPWGAGL